MKNECASLDETLQVGTAADVKFFRGDSDLFGTQGTSSGIDQRFLKF
jgi:hypothetical protein